MMRLNGWMRLWVVLSGCWLFFVGYLAYGDISELEESRKVVLSKEGLGKTTLVVPRGQSDEDIQAHIKDEIIPLFKREPEAYVGKVVTTPYDEYVREHLGKIAIEHTKIALLPIVGLLAVGWAFAWVKQGFTNASPVPSQLGSDPTDKGAQ